MNRIIKNHLPSFVITFTIAILYSCVMNLAEGSLYLSIRYVLELMVFLAAAQIVEWGLEKMDFRNYRRYLITEILLVYGLLLSFAYVGKWISFRLVPVLQLTLVYAAAMALVHYYFRRVSRIHADQINRILGERKDTEC